jgi:DNA uptake protein ComE-like DNA-binding protein
MRKLTALYGVLLLAVLVISGAAQNTNTISANSSSANQSRTDSRRNTNARNTSFNTSSQANSNSNKSSGGLIDINAASKEQLMTLQGIGDAYADKIIQGRPYKMKSDLVKRGIIPQSLYNSISSKIIAHQPKSK